MIFNDEVVAVVLCGNRHSYIKKCVASLSNTVDGIVIIYDNMYSLALSSLQELSETSTVPVYIYYKEWSNDFSKQINYALDKCNKYKWVLKIDDDERLVSEINLRENLRTVPSNIGGFKITIINPHKNVSGGLEIIESNATRLFRANRGFRYKFAVHEDVYNNIVKKGYVVERLNPNDVRLYHLGYDINTLSMADKTRKRIEQCSQMLETDDNKGLWHFYLGNHYGVMGNKNMMEYHYEKALSYPVDDSKRNTMFYKLGRIKDQ